MKHILLAAAAVLPTTVAQAEARPACEARITGDIPGYGRLMSPLQRLQLGVGDICAQRRAAANVDAETIRMIRRTGVNGNESRNIRSTIALAP
jgi:hypothetical protein